MNIINYNKVFLLFSKEKQPKGMLKGFKLFCNQYNINNERQCTQYTAKPKQPFAKYPSSVNTVTWQHNTYLTKHV